jgi:CRP/FNR family transcriptional regulator
MPNSPGLRAFPLFSQLADQAAAELESETQLRTYSNKQRIFEMGDPAQGMYMVETGRVKVFRVSPDGSEQLLGVFGPGEEFAMAPVFHGGRYPASAETLEPSRLYFLDREVLLRQIAREPELALRLLAFMAQKLQGLVSLVDSLALRDARGRLARYLARLLAREPADASGVELPMSKTLLAQHLGIKMETLSRTFRVLMEEGVLNSTERGRIEIRDREALYRAAGDEPQA